MAGQYTLSFALLVTLVVVAASAPAPAAHDKDMGVIPQENYEQFMPKQQVEYANYALKHVGTGGYFGGLSSGGDSSKDSEGSSGGMSSMGMGFQAQSQGTYKKYLPHMEQKWMEKFTGGK